MIRNLILLSFGCLLLVLTVRSLRSQRLKESYFILLVLTGLPFLVLAAWPGLPAYVAGILGMPSYHTLWGLCLAMFLILMIFKLLSIVSVQDRKISQLGQMVAILMQQQKSGDDRMRVDQDE